MRGSRQDVEKAILTLADHFGKKESFVKILEAKFGLPKTVDMIAYEMFIQQFDFNGCSDQLFNAYRIILHYAIELNTKGFVEFKND